MSTPILHDPHFQPFRSRDDVLREPQQIGKFMADPLIGLWVDAARLSVFLEAEYSRLDPAGQQVANMEVKLARLMEGGQQ